MDGALAVARRAAVAGVTPADRDGRIGVALLGYGYAGRTFHAPLLAAAPGLELRVVASSDAAKVHADLPAVEVVDDPLAAIARQDVALVVVATPNGTHAPLATAALQAGRHVVVDKPVVATVDEARRLRDLADDHDRLLMAFQNRRWDSDFLAVRGGIDAGLLGEVVHFESRMERHRPQVRERWREQPGAMSGLWWDLGPHLVDQALQLFGLPDRVQAGLATQREGAVVDDWAHAVLAFGTRRAVLHAGMLGAGAGPRFIVHGTLASATKRGIDPQEAQLLDGRRPGDAGWGVDADALEVVDAEGRRASVQSPRGDQSAFYRLVDAALRGDAPPPAGPAEIVANTAVLEAAVQSATQARTLPITLDDSERAAFEHARLSACTAPGPR